VPLEENARPPTSAPPAHSNAQLAGLVSARFRAGMRPLALGTALVVTLAAPLADLLLERRDLAHRAHLFADELTARSLNADAATHALVADDASAASALLGAAQEQRGAEDIARIQLWDPDHRLLFETQRTVAASGPALALWLTRVTNAAQVSVEEPVRSQGRLVGSLRITIVQPELLERDLLLLAVFGLLGLSLGLALYYFPLRLFREEDLVLLFARRSIRAAEEERLRLSRDLHDGLGQTLGTAAVALVRLSARLGPQPETAEAQRLLDAALDELRHVTLGLRPPSLDDLGLAAALAALAREAESTGLAATVELAELPRLDDELELACFRLAQEGLSNIIQHAQARSFRLTLARQEEALLLSIHDDGRGFSPSSGMGLGLIGARERAARLQGAFAVESAPGRGTLFRATLPLSPAR